MWKIQHPEDDSGRKIPYTGETQVGTGIKISYVPQDASFLQGSLEDMALEYDLDESLFKAMLRKLDLERSQFDKDIGQYSAGQKKKVLLARSLCQRAHLYIWDEPLNYIDVLSRIQIEQLLMAYSCYDLRGARCGILREGGYEASTDRQSWGRIIFRTFWLKHGLRT